MQEELRSEHQLKEWRAQSLVSMYLSVSIEALDFEFEISKNNIDYIKHGLVIDYCNSELEKKKVERDHYEKEIQSRTTAT